MRLTFRNPPDLSLTDGKLSLDLAPEHLASALDDVHRADLLALADYSGAVRSAGLESAVVRMEEGDLSHDLELTLSTIARLKEALKPYLETGVYVAGLNPGYRNLTPEEIAKIHDAIGDLAAANLESMRDELRRANSKHDRKLAAILRQLEPEGEPEPLAWVKLDGEWEPDRKRTPEWALRFWDLLDDDEQNEVADRAMGA